MLDPNTITEAARVARVLTQTRPDLTWAQDELEAFARADVEPDETLAAALVLLEGVALETRRFFNRARTAEAALAQLWEIRDLPEAEG